MALVGAINISMSADATKLNASLAAARVSLSGFAAAATKSLGAAFGRTDLGAGFSNIGAGISIAASMVKANAGIIASNIKGMQGLGSIFKGTDVAMLGGPLGLVSKGLGTIAVSAGQAGYALSQMAGTGLKVAFTGFRSTLTAVTDLGKKLAILGAGGGAALYKILKSGSDVTESLNKVQLMFGEQTPMIVGYADKMSKAYGATRGELLDAAGSIAGIFKDFKPDQAAQMSKSLLQIGIDAESAFNVPIKDVLGDVKSGLAGQMEPLTKYGIFLYEANVKAKAFAMGIARVGEELTGQQKIQARYALIQEGFAKAEGDRARTSTEVAARLREVGGRLTGLAEKVGGALAPAAKSLLGEMAVGLTALQQTWEANQSAITAYFTSLIGGMDSGGQSIGLFQAAVGSIADAWQSVSVAFSSVQVSVTGGIIDMIKAFDKLGGTIGSIVQYLSPAAGAFSSVFNKEALAGLENLRAEQQKTLEGKRAAEPFSKSVNAAFATARKETQRLQDELAIGGMTPTALGALVSGGAIGQAGAKLSATAPIAAKPFTEQERIQAGGFLAGGLGNIAGGIKPHKPVGEFKFASAAEAGSSEAVNTILRSKYGMGAAKPDTGIKSVAKNTTEANGHLARISAGIDKLAMYGQGGSLAPYEILTDI